MKKLITLLFLSFFAIAGYSQCSLVEVPLAARTTTSNAIVEGEVVSKFSFWDDNQHNIYTANKIKVFKQLKGATVYQYIEVITEGGTVGLDMQTVEPSLQLEVGEVGVFFLKPNQVASNNAPFQTGFQGQPKAGPQAFIKYDVINGWATDHFTKYTDPEVQVLGYIRNATNQSPTKLVKYDFSDEADEWAAKGGTTITNFTPTTATAGTATTITINGSGFGASAGTVRFSSADDGGATFVDGLATEIISWNDAQIVVEVYQEAGTGPIQVVGSATATSATDLTVSYAQLNAEFDPGTGEESYQTRHQNRHGNGGYLWRMQTDFDANVDANAAFVRSLESWRCNTQIFWEIGTVTTTDVAANDNINIVRFDNGGELPNGVLGRCTSRWSGCGGATIEWFVDELDIVFDDGTNWNFTTAAPQFTEFDFESVSVHELGHGHQLGHVINTNDVMHFSISNGEQQRNPSANNLAGAIDVQSRSVVSVCSETPMSNFSCGAAPVAEFSGTPTSICEGATVDFTDLSTNTPTGWSWTFAGGSPASSTAQNPTGISYSTAGTYQVSLTATNAFGSDDEVKVGFITVTSCGAAPVAEFSANSTSICEGASVNFTDLSTNTPTGWSWTFTGGSPASSTAQNPSNISYSSPGTYTVVLTATNASGSDDETKVAFITVNANPNVSSTASTGETCANNDGTATVTPSGGSGSFNIQWDASAGSQTTPTATGLAAGTYGVTVTDAASSCQSSTNVIVADDCNVQTTTLTGQWCPSSSVGAMNVYIHAVQVSGADLYEFRAVNAAAGYDETIQRNVHFTALSLFPNSVPGTTYDISVRARVNGNFGTFGSACQITGPPSAPTTQLKPWMCPVTIGPINQLLVGYSVGGATDYQFRAVDAATGYDETVPGRNNQPRISMYYFPNVQPNTTYDVSISIFYNGVWQPFGPACQVTTGGSVQLIYLPGDGTWEYDPTMEQVLMMTTGISDPDELDVDFILFPNPNEGQSVTISMPALQNTQNVSVEIYDIAGKQVYAEGLGNRNGQVYKVINFDGKLEKGVYLVTVTSGEQRYTQRMVVK